MWTISKVLAMAVLTGLSVMDYRIRKVPRDVLSTMYGRGDHLSGTDGKCRLEIVGGRWIKRHIIFMDQ